MDFTFDNLESLHKIAPSLASVSFLDSNFDGSNPPMGVVHASTITCLSIADSFVENLLHKQELLFYISQKYPNISELSIDINTKGLRDANEPDTQYYGWNSVLSNLASCFKKLDIRLSTQN
jgi:hypothetical protein